MHSTQEGQPLTIAEAAAQLGVSVDTVRRRIRRGDLAAQQVPTQRGPAWRVMLGTLHSEPATVGSMPGSNAMHVEAPLLAQLLADTQAELVRTAAAAAMWQARAEHLTDQVEQLQNALPAPASNSRPLTAPSDNAADVTAQTPSGRQWWPPTRWFAPA